MTDDNPLRRAGGQPRNSNAFRHGYYSAHTPHPSHAASRRAQNTLRSLPGLSRPGQFASVLQSLNLLREILRASSQGYSLAPTPHEYLSCDRGFARTLTKCLNRHDALLTALAHLDHLPRLAYHAHSLYTWKFRDRGIPTVGLPSEPEFIPIALIKREDHPPLHRYTDGEGLGEGLGVRFLTPSQLALLAPILASLRQEQAAYAEIARAAHSGNSPSPCGAPLADSIPFAKQPGGLGEHGASGAGRGALGVRSETDHPGNSPSPCGRGGRGVRVVRAGHKPASQMSAPLGADAGRWGKDLTLLNLLLLKLAFGLPWSDFPETLPVRRARRLYRGLYNTGRMPAIYILLHKHLDQHSERSLEDIADSDALTIEGRLVVPTMKEPLTWEVRTALLLLQRALFNERTQDRLQTMERRSRGLYLREVSLRTGAQRRRSDLPPTSDNPPFSPLPSGEGSGVRGCVRLLAQSSLSPSSHLEPGTWNLEPLSFVPPSLRKKDQTSQLSTGRGQPSTSSPRSSTLDSRFTSPHLQPSTFNLQPMTSHLIPSSSEVYNQIGPASPRSTQKSDEWPAFSPARWRVAVCRPGAPPVATRKTKAEKPSEVSPREPGAPRGAGRAQSPGKAPIVVGIGASAGGLQALQTFFDSLSADTGMAYVVITHLHPSYESHLAELLQPHTSMPVTQVQGETPLVRDQVYVMPPNRRMILTDSHLDLEEFEEPRGRRVPIDQFFRSLAAAHRDSIAVILSGSGTDGSLGVKDIKADGGLLLVQSPDEAEYDGMPRAAISTGLADLVLPAQELAAKLVEYARHEPQLPFDPDELTEKQHDLLDRILAQVHVRTGNDFTQYKRSTILRRIMRRMQLNGFATLGDYLGFLRQNGGEADAMFNDILIGVTTFFRDPPSWDALAEKVIPLLFKHPAAGEAVRVWSAGCATGEEAYSLAMLLREHASGLDRHYDIQVFASDLAEGALVAAREGLYPAAIEADLSQERLERFFTQESNRYRVKRELRDMVLFTNHNLLRDPPFSHINLIVCRNLLIYLQRGVQDILFDTFHYALNSGGYLFLGSSESAESVPDLFSPVDATHRIYHSRPWRGPGPHVPALPLAARRTRAIEEPARSARPLSRNYSTEAASLQAQHDAALETYGPPSILVDEKYNVLHVSETAGRFLLQPRGVPTRVLPTLVRKELQSELQSALFQAFERGRATFTKPIAVRFNGSTHRVVLAVQPRRSQEAEPQFPEKQALVVFLEDEFDEAAQTEEPERKASGHDQDEMVSQLEGEARRLREQLQSVVEEYNSSNEEMKAANEELQSINEEYRSTTEELETSKEELQSVNEELQTVNNELKSHVDEITRTNSDLENLMSGSEIATLFLDREMQIKRYTAGMEKVISLLDSDRGRPVAHLANKLGYEELVSDSEEVLRTLVSLEREVHSKDGKWFQVRLRPYRTIDHRIDGVVVSFVDITELKRTGEALETLNRSLQGGIEERTRSLNDSNRRLSQAIEMFSTLFNSNPVPTSINRLQDWEFLNVNDAYLSFFGVGREQIIGKTSLQFGFASGVELRDRIRADLEATGLIRGLELQLEWPPGSGEMRTMLGSFQHVRMEEDDIVISSFIDITDRIEAEQEIRRLASELTVAEQEERHRISQVLHDELQQRLFAIRMQLSFLREAYEEGRPESFQADLPELEQWLGEAIETVRNLSLELSPMILKEEGLPQALEWLAMQMHEKFGLEVELEGADTYAPLSYSLRILLYRSIRELLFNVVKHASTRKARVQLERRDSRLRIAVFDEGVGFDPAKVLSRGNSSFGFGSIQSKLRFLGCMMKIESAPGSGTRVTVDAPVDGNVEG